MEPEEVSIDGTALDTISTNLSEPLDQKELIFFFFLKIFIISIFIQK
jgi:hypothetical protein